MLLRFSSGDYNMFIAIDFVPSLKGGIPLYNCQVQKGNFLKQYAKMMRFMHLGSLYKLWLVYDADTTKGITKELINWDSLLSLPCDIKI